MPASSYAVGPHWRLVFQDMGLDSARLLKLAGLPEDLFSRGATRISQAEYSAYWKAVDQVAVSVPVPVTFAKTLTVEAFGAYVFAAVCCTDLNSAAERIANYKPIIGPTRIHVARDEHRTRLMLTWPEGMEVPESIALVELLFWVALVRLTTRSDISPIEVSGPILPHRPEAYREYLGVDVTPAPTWSISFAAKDAARVFLTANEAMWQFFEPALRKRLSELQVGATFSERVRAALLELLPAGGASMEAVGTKLAMGKRTIQRRLGDENVTFQGLLAETRAALARHYLQQSDLPAASISFLLGYDDPNSFYRAFHTWTGMTPDAFRSGRSTAPGVESGALTRPPSRGHGGGSFNDPSSSGANQHH